MEKNIMGKYVTQELKDFYAGKGRNVFGMTLSDIWDWIKYGGGSFYKYIPWLFPLGEEEKSRMFSPVLSQEQIQELRKEPIIMGNMVVSLYYILEVYGMRLDLSDKDNLAIAYQRNFTDYTLVWKREKRIRYKRILRILQSLRLFGIDGLADAFQNALRDISGASWL